MYNYKCPNEFISRFSDDFVPNTDDIPVKTLNDLILDKDTSQTNKVKLLKWCGVSDAKILMKSNLDNDFIRFIIKNISPSHKDMFIKLFAEKNGIECFE